MIRTTLAFALLAGSALAQGDAAPPFTPPIPSSSSPAPAPNVSEERLAAMIDTAIGRAMQRQAATAPAPSGQSAYATASPQAFTQPAPVQYATMPVTTVQFATQQPITSVQQQVQVLVPPGPIHRAMGRFGEHMAHKGDSKIKTLSLAPATTTMVAQPVTTTTMQAVPIPQAPAAYTPPLPSKSAPAMASQQR